MAYTSPIFSDPLYTQNAYNQSNIKKNGLGKEDFLKLLIAQLKNQDPLNPMKDTEFIAQLANFSTLEQMSNMNNNMEEFLKLQQYQNTVIAVTMIGKEVISIDGQSGVVSGVTIDENGVSLAVGDKKIALSQVKEIKNSVT